MRRERGDVLAPEEDASRIGTDEAGDLADEGRLAGAVRPDHGMDLAGRHVEGNLVGHLERPVALCQALQPEQRLSHRRSVA
jgi:hypothetical protein